MTGSYLQPAPELLGDEWRAMVEAENEQVERLREWRDADHYAPIAHHFADDPRRTDDGVLDTLRAYCRPDADWIDVGAGGGRYALPLALASRHVTAVEPSAGMREVIRAGMVEHTIDNVEVGDVRWPDPTFDRQADFGLIAHVGYDIREINPFLDALERATRRRCFSLMMDRAPSSGFGALWETVHGEARRELPGMREMLHLLLARGAAPEVRLFPRGVGSFDRDDVRQMARRRLWLSEGSEKDGVLQRALDQMDGDVGTDFGFPTLVAVMSWEPVIR